MDKTRKIDSKLITETVKKLFIEANINLGQDVICSLQDALAREESPLGRQVLEKIIDNAEIARREKMPICQDTG
ncbi:MAG TPA: fumarate hydratase, partial [Smithellaceae bacterium]|nr:fumarate hydratase [Smithellaceae bacterium]HNT92009.1 fumarate hydratase [Smithellaceae bacterium]HNZ32577.1 fumarate hydratase [Smithellaceae bacterium]HOU05745.1 fumarate hydratase [Smithellaceae bacterium]HQG96952.1 fumarate hydratase [Smithellaceae bacterium]